VSASLEEGNKIKENWSGFKAGVEIATGGNSREVELMVARQQIAMASARRQPEAREARSRGDLRPEEVKRVSNRMCDGQACVICTQPSKHDSGISTQRWPTGKKATGDRPKQGVRHEMRRPGYWI
jgi:hypothetical protein